MPPPKDSFVGIVGREKVSMRSRVSIIWNRLKTKSATMFKELFKGVKTRAEAVASFMATLELIKINKIRVEYGEDGDISNPSVYRADDGALDISTFED